MAIKIPIISEYDKRGQDAAETGLGKLGKSAKKLAKIGAAAFAAVGAGALVMGKKLIDAGERAATSNARIEEITKSMGQFEGATDQVTDRLIKLAEKDCATHWRRSKPDQRRTSPSSYLQECFG
jgi:hypothetical protein